VIKNFLEILLKPLKYDNLILTIIKFLLLIMPFAAAAYFLGIYSWISIALLSVALIVILGYFFLIFKNELEEKKPKYPDKSFLECFFIGLKGLLFYSIYMALLAMILYGLYNTVILFPAIYNEALFATILIVIIWLFVIYPIAVGLFSDKFNPLHAIEVLTILEIAGNSWLNYLKASIYMGLYAAIIIMISWGILFITKYSLTYPVIAGLSLLFIYLKVLYYILYANTYKKLRSEFESHI